jgi:hypothetical protein
MSKPKKQKNANADSNACEAKVPFTLVDLRDLDLSTFVELAKGLVEQLAKYQDARASGFLPACKALTKCALTAGSIQQECCRLGLVEGNGTISTDGQSDVLDVIVPITQEVKESYLAYVGKPYAASWASAPDLEDARQRLERAIARLKQSAVNAKRLARKRGRPSYSLEGKRFAIELWDKHPKEKLQWILGECRKVFGKDNLPANVNDFRRFLSRHHKNI